MPDWPDLAALAQQYPGNLSSVPLDAGNDESVRAAAQVVGAETDSLDLLINNAGITARSAALTIRVAAEL